jgi:beta-lactamase class A
MADLPMSNGQIRAHFNARYLTVMSPEALNELLEKVVGPKPVSIKLVSIKVDEPSMVAAVIATGGAVPQDRLSLVVDSQGLISWLGVNTAVAGPVPDTWAGVDAALRSAAPQVRMLVANVSNGSCQPLHNIDADTVASIGSVFKLYVLDALGKAVAAGRVKWIQRLPVTTQVKSFPSGVLQNEPDGTQISVQDAAAKMISISDNTAADMLIHLLGRRAVEASLTRTGMANPAPNRPFLTTREVFLLMLEDWPTLAERYLAADEAGRRKLLSSTVDRLPLPDVAAAQPLATRPDIGLGHAASASDICRAYLSLVARARQPALSPIGQALSLNDQGLDLDPAQWKTTWYKGAVGPRHRTHAYLATTHTGQSYVVIVLAENPSQPINEIRTAPVILGAIKGAFTLAARG